MEALGLFEIIFIIIGLFVAGGAGYALLRRPQLPPAPKKEELPPQKDEVPAPVEDTEPSVPTEAAVAEPPLKPVPDRKEYRTLEDALAKTREGFWGRVKSAFSGKTIISSNEIEDLEEILYTSDLGPKTVDFLINRVSEKMEGDQKDIGFLQESLKSEIKDIFSATNGDRQKLDVDHEPAVWMVVGVNGAGKTTTIGKLASQQVAAGKRVLIAAGDTFRAAADAQLKVWADRADVEIFSPENVKDPSAVAFDAVQKAKAKEFDLIIIDTAGRLHTQKNLMEELKKMKRVMTKALEGSPHEVLLVLDANSGQNALMQAEQFHEALGLTGVIITKMDGSAKGGVAVGIACEHKLPIKMIGVGEKIEDLRPFSSKDFVDSII